MPTYQEVITQSHENVKALSAKLNDLEIFKNQLSDLTKSSKELPLKFNQRFTEITELSQKFTEDLGKSSRNYIDGTNLLLEQKIGLLEKEISRLENVDLVGKFNVLEDKFLKNATQQISSELLKIDEKNSVFQTHLHQFDKEIQRLAAIDLESHFNKHQKMLSEIFNAISSINILLTGVTQSLNTLLQYIGDVKVSIRDNHNDLKLDIEENRKKSEANFVFLQTELQIIERQNSLLKKEIGLHKIISMAGFCFLIILLVILLFK